MGGPGPSPAWLVLFIRLVAIAHVLDEFQFGATYSLSSWLIVGLGAWVMARPRAWVVVAAMAATKVVTVVHEHPFINNHDLIFAIIDAGLVVGVLAAWLGTRRANAGAGVHAPDWEILRRFFRVALLTAYGVAALSKLNAGFLDPDTSCAVDLTFRALSPVADEIQVRSWTPALIWTTLPVLVAAIELSVPLLLWRRATRTVGVVLAVTFHVVLAASPDAIGLAFTGLLVAAMVPFLTDRQVEVALRSPAPVSSVAARVRDQLPRLASGAMPAIAAVAVAAIGLAAATGRLAPLPPMWWWLMLPSIVVMSAVVMRGAVLGRAPRRGASVAHTPQAVAATERSRHSALIGVLAMLLVPVPLSFASPYVGAGTTPVFTMYSNLQTEHGTTNHLFVPRLAVFATQDEHVQIVDSTSADVRRFHLTGLVVTMHEARRIATSYVGHTIDVIDVRTGETTTVRYDAPPSITERAAFKLVRHRPITTGAPSCQW